MIKDVYVVVDVYLGFVSICIDYQTAYEIATKYVKSNLPYKTLEECEEVWIECVELNTLLI